MGRLPARSMQRWMEAFHSSGKDIFEFIKHAILIAALYHPGEFQLRRDRFAEMLFATREMGDDGGVKTEVLKKLDEESWILKEVLRIKEVISNELESENVLLKSLRQLKLIAVSMETLYITEIGKAVNALRRATHSEKIKRLAQSLILGWRSIVDDWISATSAIAGNSLAIEKSLPSPPLDVEASNARAKPVCEFFNYIYGNESKFNWTNIQNESSSGHEADPLAQRKDTMQYMNADIASGSKIETNQVCFRSPNTEIKAKQPEGSGDQNKKLKESEEEALAEAKFERTKQKLHEIYENNAKKKRRTIPLLKLDEIPKFTLKEHHARFPRSRLKKMKMMMKKKHNVPSQDLVSEVIIEADSYRLIIYIVLLTVMDESVRKTLHY
ncbi:probable mediator of RNA polymerase II transcription subunit 26b [Dioscorea cayenensis subsp. rotundata]|uniref:Probable mediator of RNA polymerase II transcription subunit 26b n=1 Tax=Dioscorea cayennensis subsp. rotundata TaxID=55577 RepID=A0AB40C7J1_DIOCR|nr:probable mediator of RNA polymerase II transcription subunit 26b [Dioscorea cayenensis subsp. rotundata]